MRPHLEHRHAPRCGVMGNVSPIPMRGSPRNAELPDHPKRSTHLKFGSTDTNPCSMFSPHRAQDGRFSSVPSSDAGKKDQSRLYMIGENLKGVAPECIGRALLLRIGQCAIVVVPSFPLRPTGFTVARGIGGPARPAVGNRSSKGLVDPRPSDFPILAGDN
jgi:hypothetical protein